MRNVILIPLAAFIIVGAGCRDSEELPVNDSLIEETEEETKAILEIEDDAYVIDAETSSMLWTGAKVTGEHTGTIEIKSGAMTVEDGAMTEGSVVIDMTTIDCCEEPEGSLPSLVTHLHSDDFFSTEDHPTAEFIMTEFKKGDAAYEVKGTLTIKGIENEIEFQANVEAVDEEYRLTASVELDRTLWDIRYESASFFSNLGDSVIDDEFTLEFDVMLVAE